MDDAVVGAVLIVTALDRLIAARLGEHPAAPGHGITLAISQRDRHLTLAGRVLWCLRRFHRGLLGSRLMLHEQSRPGWFDADREVVDGCKPGWGHGFAQGQWHGWYGVEDDHAVAIVVTNLESELDNGEARTR